MYRCGITCNLKSASSLLLLSLLQTGGLFGCGLSQTMTRERRREHSEITSIRKESHCSQVTPNHLCGSALGMIKSRCMLLTVSLTDFTAKQTLICTDCKVTATYSGPTLKISIVIYLYQACKFNHC